jgi:hypothetical protein
MIRLKVSLARGMNLSSTSDNQSIGFLLRLPIKSVVLNFRIVCLFRLLASALGVPLRFAVFSNV